MDVWPSRFSSWQEIFASVFFNIVTSSAVLSPKTPSLFGGSTAAGGAGQRSVAASAEAAA